jgi:hypothetical protein
LAEVRKRIAANDCELRRLIAEQRKIDHRSCGATGRNETNPGVFICKSGEVIADPFDPKMLELHGPHFVVASLDRVEEGLERWRATYGTR